MMLMNLLVGELLVTVFGIPVDFWASARYTDVQMWKDLFTMVLFQIWVGHGFCHVSSHRVSAHLPWYCGHLQSDRNIALQILCHNLERGNRKPEVID